MELNKIEKPIPVWDPNYHILEDVYDANTNDLLLKDRFVRECTISNQDELHKKIMELTQENRNASKIAFVLGTNRYSIQKLVKPNK